MEFRFLGNSGLKVSAISYGNWVTHTEGKACCDDDLNGYSVGTGQQPGTVMHELVHTLVLQHGVIRLGQFFLQTPHGRVAVLEIAGHRPLAAVEVERSDAVARCGERDCGVDRGRRLAGPALFVGEDDEMRLAHA